MTKYFVFADENYVYILQFQLNITLQNFISLKFTDCLKWDNILLQPKPAKMNNTAAYSVVE